MSGVVMVSTRDLPTAGAVRSAFQAEGYTVDLVTPDEDLGGIDEPLLLVLTGLSGEADGIGLARQAHKLHVPVFGAFAVGAEGWRAVAHALGLDESFVGAVDSDEISLLGRRAIERRHLQRLTGIVGESEAIREALERVLQIAPVSSTVLITGESGTGKELVARGIRALSPRRHKSFIAVNVAALAETLLESELFGHEKGAFTGAIDARKGLFELAHGGTIFLDEIGEMSRSTQTKLLRVLETREFLRVGGEKAIKVDVRIITATNQELRRLVASGDFRQDLYYRLNVLRIELPPLRERRDDIPLLVDAFVEQVGSVGERRFEGISEDAMAILMGYDWPGNIRELRNLVESMVVLAPGRVIRPEDIPSEIRSPEASSRFLPTPIRPAAAGGGEGVAVGPEMEFIFRTLVTLRVDMDDLKREFEAYQSKLPGWTGERALPSPRGREIMVVSPEEEEAAWGPAGTGPAGPTILPRDVTPGITGSIPGASQAQDIGSFREPVLGEDQIREGSPQGSPQGVVVYRDGMTMEDLEREAITAALDEVGGNRRKAAAKLGIGERTLYRKIRRYELEGHDEEE